MDVQVGMRVLPPRTYAPDAPLRAQHFTPEAMKHPAKMHTELCRDLFLRYTQPGQTVLDPFGGIGTSLIGALFGRNVILHELEPPFVELARANWERLRRRPLPHIPLGEATILQGDSRHLPLPDAPSADAAITSPPYADAVNQHAAADNLERRLERMASAGVDTSKRVNVGGPNGGHRVRQNYAADACLTSPPFGAMNSPTAGGNVKLRPAADGAGFAGERADFLYSESTPGQIGNLPHVALTSPPYVDARQDWPTPEGAENIRYDSTAGQIGGLAHGDVAAVVSSPPYGDVADRNRSAEPYSQQMDPALKAKYGSGDVNRHIDGYGTSSGQIGALPHAAITSPPYGNAASRDEAGIRERRGRDDANGFFRADHFDGRARSMLNQSYGDSEGQIGNGEGETYAAAMLAVLRECYRVVRPGGVLVLVTGNYVRNGRIIDLAADSILLAQAAGWTPVERWRHEKAVISFWRRLHHKQGRPVVTHEDVLVFCKGAQPAWAFTDLPPTTTQPVDLDGTRRPVQRDLFSLATEGD